MSAAASQRDGLAKSVAQDELAIEDLQELRLALVMTGGVSLAIWMGGTTLEFDRVIRGENATYLDLLRLTRTLPRIDVVAGTSAGGLNGALLAYAITQDTGVAGLRELWLELGALEKLLRPPTQANPRSLMLGDDYFLPQIKSAISQLEGPGTSPDDVPMELIITTTLLKPWPRGVPDTFGTIIHDVDHRGEFLFRRGASLKDDDPSPDDGFDVPDIHARLALAARCTASFPLAFEASYVPIGSVGTAPLRPDMTDVANFQRSRFAIDGGVLLNRPLRPALRAIFRQPASKQVRRVLAYVVPDPGEEMKVEPDDPTDAPSLADVSAASMVRLPRNQSVSVELDELTLHNARVDVQRRRRELVVVDLGADELARKAYPHYRGVRADGIAAWLLALIARGLTALELQERPLAPAQRKVTSEAPLLERRQLRERLTAHLENLPPVRFPGSGEESTEWFTTVDTAERAAGVVLDLLRRGLAVMDPREKELTDHRRELQRLRTAVFAELTAAQATRKPLEREDELTLARDAVLALRRDQAEGDDNRKTALRDWAKETLPQILGDPEKLDPIVGRIADELQPAATAVLEACRAAPKQLESRAAETAHYAEALVRGVGNDRGTSVTPHYRLLALEVAQIALGGQPTLEQRADLIQVSADTGNGLDPREQAEDKLAGLQAVHFGAFYKRSWRANDWMWGRHDAAQRLAQLLLEPARLRQLGYSVDEALERIETIAFKDLNDEDARVLRTAKPRCWDPEKAKAELSFLSASSETPPAIIPMCAQAVARRLQLDILREELPEVREAIAWDEDDGAHMSTEARQFCDQFDRAPQPLTAADAIGLFAACGVGQERIASESGSDLLARTATRTLAVTTSAFSGQGSGLPKLAQRPMTMLRGLGLMLYLVVSHALVGSRFGAMVVSAGLFAGAALVGVGLVVAIPGVLMVVGLGAMLAAVFLALWRRKLTTAVAALAVGLLVALLPRVFGGWVFDGIDDDAVHRWEPVFVVAGLLAGAFILGRASFNWPEKGRTPDHAGPA
jgi:patatin-related protein